MKRRAIATTAVLALLVLGTVSSTLTYSMASSNSTSTQTGEHEHDNETDHEDEGHLNLTVGATLTFSNLAGHWVAFNHMEGEDDHESPAPPMGVHSGNSTGSFTFKVTSHSDEGFNLTITAGSFTINGTTYTVSTGHVTLNEGGESGFGNGTASGGATFEIHVAGIHGNTASAAQVSAIRLDVKVGKSEYLVILGSNEGVEEDSDSD